MIYLLGKMSSYNFSSSEYGKFPCSLVGSLLKMAYSRPLFLYFRLFHTDLIQLIENKLGRWIRTTDLWHW